MIGIVLNPVSFCQTTAGRKAAAFPSAVLFIYAVMFSCLFVLMEQPEAQRVNAHRHEHDDRVPDDSD